MKKIIIGICFTLNVFAANAQCFNTNMSVNNSCDGNCNGFVSMTFQGGTMPYWLTLNGPVTMGPFQVTTAWSMGNLCPGNYTLLLIDNNGDTCTTTGFQISISTPVDVTVITTNASCSACNDGTATISNITGGSPPYNYQWSNGAAGASITGLTPGVYNIYAVDASGCVDVDTFYIGVGAGSYMTVSGMVYYDTNQNGNKDLGEIGLGNQDVQMIPGPVNAITNNLGDYGIVVGAGTYDITYQPTAGWQLTSLPATHNVVVSTNSLSGLDFGVYPDSTAGAASVSISSGFPRCFWDVLYGINITNTGFTILNGTAEFTYDPSMTYVSSTVIPDSHIGNLLTYSFSNLYPGQSVGIMITLTEPAGGTAITNSLSVDATDSFSNIINESTSLTQIVSCSWDPNDKQVQPEGFGQFNYVEMDEWLTYQVRFQNTGTDTAFRVVILDTLDAALDLNTFIFIGSSHPVEITMRTGNELSFVFDNIFLPDSNVNEPASHGYVLYKIKGLSSNPDPTIVNNTAYIYFDLNSPVQTNVTLTTLSDNFLGIADESSDDNLFSIYPNPMSNSADLIYNGPGTDEFDVEIFDVTGRSVRSVQKMTQGKLTIPKNDLNAGTYFVKVNSDKYFRLVVQ